MAETLNNLASQYNAPTPTLPTTPNLTSDALKSGDIVPFNAPAPADPYLKNIEVPKVIDSTLLNPSTPKVDMPTLELSKPPQSSNLAEEALKQLETTQTENQKLAEKTSKDIYSLIGQLTGQDQALTDAENQFGVSQKRQALQDLNNQIIQKKAELDKSDVELARDLRAQELRDTTIEFVNLGKQQIAGDAQITRALKNSEIGVLNAQVLAAQGNLDLALQQAQQAVASKYTPIKEMIDMRRLQLEAITPLLSRDEKKQAQEQELKMKFYLDGLDRKRAKEETNVKLALSTNVNTRFVNKNGTFFDANTGEEFATPEQFFKSAGVSSFDEAYKRGIVTDYNPSALDNTDFISKIRQKYPDAGITTTDTEDQIRQKLAKSRIYQKETYMARSSGGGGGSGRVSGTGTGVSSLTQSIAVNPKLFNTLTPSAKGQVIAELQRLGETELLKNLGGKVLNNTQLEQYNQTKSSLVSLNDLAQIIKENEDLIGPIAGLSALNPYSDARKVQAKIDAVKQRVGKALEGGVLRKEDEEKYKKILATITDTPSTALYKIDELTNDVQNQLDTFMESATSAGYNTSGFDNKKTIRVKDKKTGQTGSIPEEEFDSNLYEIIN